MLWRALRSAFKPRASAEPRVRRALDLSRAGLHAEAEALLRRAVAEHPRDAAAATNLAVALLEQDRAAHAVTWLTRALEIDAGFAPAHFNYAHVLKINGRLADALSHYRAAAHARNAMPEAHEALMYAALEACDWDAAEAVAAELRERAAREPAELWMKRVSPLTAAYLGLDAGQCKAVAAFHAPPPAREALVRRRDRSARPGRLRIAYLSRDFRDHPVGHVLKSALAHHDRSRFEVHAYSWGGGDDSVYRRAIADSVDRFVDISRMGDDEAARSIAGAGVDLAIDLMGHTTGNRLGILAKRPAPVQAHYLGYPGTTGAAYVDCFVGDAIATPAHLDAQFSERIVRVEQCFMVADGGDALAAPATSRAAHGLPGDALVCCNFGDPSRITRRTFELWLTILAREPRALLWLRKTNPLAAENLRARASACGLDPARIVFAERVAGKPAHLARLGCADLALDTLGWYNGHSTTADLLWAGVPVLTAPGETFASRVAASLVSAAGGGELVVDGDDAYADAALSLARDPARTRALHRQMLEARTSAPFFDTPALVRGLEDAFERMYAERLGELIA
ncbi:MAG TPA: tetratricopeptide repeat protein [Burkholderiales bacterium]|nr:tetratricopeptide repeat protein [Burkholderiales bacterium]